MKANSADRSPNNWRADLTKMMANTHASVSDIQGVVWAVRSVFWDIRTEMRLAKALFQPPFLDKVTPNHGACCSPWLGSGWREITSTLFVFVLVYYSWTFRSTDRPVCTPQPTAAASASLALQADEPSTLKEPQSRSTITNSMGAT